MIKIFFLFFLFLPGFVFCEQSNKSDLGLSLDIDRVKTAIFFGIIDRDSGQNNETNLIIDKVANLLTLSDQFDIVKKSLQEPNNKKDITDLFYSGYSVVIFFDLSADKKFLEWRLYDSAECFMLKGKKYLLGDLTNRCLAYYIATDILKEMIGEESSFCSKISFIKSVKNSLGKRISKIYICNFDGSDKQEISVKDGYYVGLCWNNDISKVRLFYSDCTKFNVKLMTVDLFKRSKSIINVPGTCVGISFSKNHDKAIYCKSGEIFLYEFNLLEKKGKHKLLISNDGKNSDPVMLSNGDIVFCSDAKDISKNKSSNPKICYFEFNSQAIKLITENGYCVGPAYCEYKNQIAYSKKINGIMQIFIYDILDKTHKQITFDSGDKIDISFAPKGDYIFFCHQDKKNSRIASVNLDTKKIFYITNLNEICVGPKCSPIYTTFPFVVK